MIVGAATADANGADSGAAYVIYGKSSAGDGDAVTNTSIPAADGFLIKGAAAGDQRGYLGRGAGDVNGDGRADVIVGAYGAAANGADSGAAYVIYGKATPATVTLSNTSIPAADGFLIQGAAAGDQAGPVRSRGRGTSMAMGART